MREPILFIGRAGALLLGAGLLGLGCGGDSVAMVCARTAECFNNDCDLTEAACAEQARGVEGSCFALADADRRAWATTSEPICEACLETKDLLQDCLASLNSCDAFEAALNPFDPSCSQQWGDQFDACDDDAQNTCLE